MTNLKMLRNAIAGGAVALLAAAQASAVSVVTAGVTTQLTDTQTDIITVGGAVLAIVVVAASFKYVRRAL